MAAFVMSDSVAFPLDPQATELHVQGIDDLHERLGAPGTHTIQDGAVVTRPRSDDGQGPGNHGNSVVTGPPIGARADDERVPGTRRVDRRLDGGMRAASRTHVATLTLAGCVAERPRDTVIE